MNTLTEENYLKTIYHLSLGGKKKVSTSELANALQINAASVTDKLKKMLEKGLVDYEKSRGVILSKQGQKLALQVVRKHRLWELFLVKILHFKWKEVHPIAEQLEHVHSDDLINRIDEILGFPKFDPHGDPIPNKNGKMEPLKAITLMDAKVGNSYQISHILNHDNDFLDFLDSNKLIIGKKIQLVKREKFDQSIEIKMGDKTLVLSEKVCSLLLVSE